MNSKTQPAAAVTFYGAIPDCRPPMRADPSVLGTLPSRGFQYCEALRAASSFGWYVFPPIDFTLQWDGADVRWTYRGAQAWYRLGSAQFPGYSDTFDRVAPAHLRGRLVGLFSMSALGLRAFSGVTVGVSGALIGIHWSLGLSAIALFAVTVALLAYAVSPSVST